MQQLIQLSNHTTRATSTRNHVSVTYDLVNAFRIGAKEERARSVRLAAGQAAGLGSTQGLIETV